MTHDKAQEAAQRLQDNVQYARDTVDGVRQQVDGARETYQQAVDSGIQNVSGGEDIVMQVADTVIASGILEKIGAEYGATGAAVVAVLVGLYWTWRKKSGDIKNEIQQQEDEESKENQPLAQEEKEKQKEDDGSRVTTEPKEEESPQKEVAKLKSLEEEKFENEGGITTNGEGKPTA